MSSSSTVLPSVPRPGPRLAGLAEWMVRRLLSPLAATAYTASLATMVLVSFSPTPAARADMLAGAALGAAFVIVLASLLVVTGVLRAALFAADMASDDD